MIRKEVLTARYCCSRDAAAAIVAVVNYLDDETVYDWACYFGATDRTFHEQDAVEAAADHGDKMSAADAHYFFPGVPIERYRP